MRHILFVGGFARAGKTTTMEILSSLGVPCFSTSSHLEVMAAVSFSQFNNRCDFRELSKEHQREVKIFFAEKVLVPFIGRENALVLPVVTKALASPEDLVAIETIGGEEFRLFLSQTVGVPVTTLNVRGPSEMPGVDSRRLLPSAIELMNNGTILELRENLISLVKTIRGNLG
jgi:hypothetical protein